MAKRRRAPKADPAFVALIGDMVASRELQPRLRARLQSALQAKIEYLNDDLGHRVLAARITITSGDEVQALFREASHVVRVVRELSEVLFLQGGGPLRMRFGIGRGTLTTGPIPTPWAPNPALLDGRALQNARIALVRARDFEQWACFEDLEDAGPDGFRPHTDLALEALFALMGAIREDWTERQGRLSVQFRKGFSQAELAEELRVNRSVVSETLKAAHHNLLLQGEGAAVALLEALVDKKDPR